jgi:hypothetical protein
MSAPEHYRIVARYIRHGNKKFNRGEVVQAKDIPAESRRWLTDQGIIEPVEVPAPAEDAEREGGDGQ